MVFPGIICPPLDAGHGLGSQRQGQTRRNAQGSGQNLCDCFPSQPHVCLVLAKIVDLTTVNSVRYGMKVGFAIWLGFVTTVQLTAKLFENKPTKLYLINTGYQLVCYLVMGAILAVWQ